MSELTDEELVNLVRTDDTVAEFELYHRYYFHSKSLVKSFEVNYKNTLICYEDLVSVAFSSVYVAVKKYTEGKSFFLYWTAIAKNALINYIKLNKNFTAQVSLDDSRYIGNDIITLHDSLGDYDNQSTDDLKNAIEKYIYSENSNLTDDEALVAHYLYYRQYTLDEIEEKTKWKSAKVYYVVGCTRKKISDYLKKRIFN